jgi:hypothetical protein
MPETDSSRRWPDSQALPEERTLAFRTVPSSMRRRVQHRLKASQNYQLRAATCAEQPRSSPDQIGGYLHAELGPGLVAERDQISGTACRRGTEYLQLLDKQDLCARRAKIVRWRDRTSLPCMSLSCVGAASYVG